MYKTFGTGFWRFSGPGREPKIDEKRARRRKSASGDGAGSGVCGFLLWSPFGVALRNDFGTVRPLKILLFPRRERDFDKIAVFEKNTEKVAPGDPFWDPKRLKIDAGASQNRKKVRKKVVF